MEKEDTIRMTSDSQVIKDSLGGNGMSDCLTSIMDDKYQFQDLDMAPLKREVEI